MDIFKIVAVIFILGFCILLHVLYQGYWKNRPWQQLFKVFIPIYFAATCFGPRWPSSGRISNTQRIRCSEVTSRKYLCIPPEDGNM
jgi:hypothetical protein